MNSFAILSAMVGPDEQKHRYDFARLLTQIEELRSRAAQDFAKRLTPEQRKNIADRLRDVLNKLTGRKS